MDYPGSDEASLRRPTTALARDAIFGRDALCRSSLSGKNNTGSLEKHKLDYIKAVVKSRMPNMPEVAFEGIWSKCRGSLSQVVPDASHDGEEEDPRLKANIVCMINITMISMP